MGKNVASAKGLYALFTSLSLVYVVICYSQINRNDIFHQLEKIDVLYQLITMAVEINLIHDPTKLNDLNCFYFQASVDKWHSRLQGDSQQLSDSKPENQIIDRTYVIKNIPGRLAFKRECDFLVSHLSEGAQFNVVSRGWIPKFYDIKSENISLLDPDICMEAFPLGLTFLMFRAPGGEIAFGIPRRAVPNLPYLEPVFDSESFYFKQKETIKSLLPEIIVKYARIEDAYSVHSIDTLRASIVRFASKTTRNFYTAAQLDDAVEELFRAQPSTATFAGVSAPVELLVQIRPIIIFSIMWTLWRVIRKMSLESESDGGFWLAQDARDWIGLCGAIIYGVFPFLLSMLILFFLGAAIGQIRTIFGYGLDLMAAWRGDWSVIIIQSYRSSIEIYATTLGVLSVIFIVISFLVTKKLLTISVTSWRSR